MCIILFLYSLQGVFLYNIIIFQFYSYNYQDFAQINNKKKSSHINDNKYKDSELYKELEKYKNENEDLKKEINLLKEENKKLINDLKYASNTIINMRNMSNEINNITNNEIQKLKDEIMDKENQINKLKVELQNNKNDKKLTDLNDILSVTFISTEKKMNNHKISCLKTDRFAEIEEKLYQEFEEFRETNNIFIVNGRIIYRFKKMSENNINNGDTIQLIKNA